RDREALPAPGSERPPPRSRRRGAPEPSSPGESTAGPDEDCASSAGVVARQAARRSARADVEVGRHLEVLEVERRDLRERWRRDDAAEDRAVRLVDADEDDEPRVAGGHDADEGGDVLARLVPTRPRH